MEVIHLVGIIILAVIVLILLLLLFMPLGVSADYSAGQFKAGARVLCFDLPLYPRPEKKPSGKEKPPKPKKEKPPKPEKPKKEGGLHLTKEMLPELAKLALRTLSRFRRKLTVNRFVLHVTVGGGDPYDAVMAYGAINYAVATVGSAAGHAFNVRRSDVQTGIDFSTETYKVEAGITVTINLARIIAVLAAAGAGFLKIKRRADKAAKAAAKERKDNDGTDADTDGAVS